MSSSELRGRKPTPDATTGMSAQAVGSANPKAGRPVACAGRGQYFEWEAASVSDLLPHPEHFRAYEEALPGAADRILTMAENQQRQRHRQQARIVTAEGSLDKHGQWILFAISLLALASGFTLIGLGKPVEGIASVVGAVGTAVGLAVWSTRR